jgi:hypothetical protein
VSGRRCTGCGAAETRAITLTIDGEKLSGTVFLCDYDANKLLLYYGAALGTVLTRATRPEGEIAFVQTLKLDQLEREAVAEGQKREP